MKSVIVADGDCDVFVLITDGPNAEAEARIDGAQQSGEVDGTFRRTCSCRIGLGLPNAVTRHRTRSAAFTAAGRP